MSNGLRYKMIYWKHVSLFDVFNGTGNDRKYTVYKNHSYHIVIITNQNITVRFFYSLIIAGN